MLGSTEVIASCPVDQVQLMHIGSIRHAIKTQTQSGVGLILTLTANSLRKPLETIQAFMGDDIGVTGTMGNPVIISPYIRHLNKVLETTLFRIFMSEFIFKPPLNDDEARIEVFAEYLMRFAEYGYR